MPKDAAAERPDEATEPKAADAGSRPSKRSRCGTCGYVLAGSRAEKACPACGSGPEALGPFESRLGPKRSRLLGLRLHPIAAHGAPAFAASVLALSAAIAAVGDVPVKTALVDTARVLTAAMPIAIVAAFLTGLLDGRLRFKKRTTPILLRKMAASALFLALSFAAAALALFTPLDATVLAPFAVLAALEAGCALYLGRKGAGLRDAAVPD